ncbi:hypothetical protein BCR33DRAFT_412221 [Rhizoclosmatium globosum]|uniref:Uncharacterized protein n=1 Tax=Rhizoclosmatium globosum TaxID=329046 RepID=A0A1Y2BX75_9FUNG|nr:hypothetical protein BCR33DRAFT_412221 [Rhizoclosmatium globosum]|eukprot:ORY39370.1 hypothetical protein BCR33DRAFT_412221 [Rhizoclosmatium globosum]
MRQARELAKKQLMLPTEENLKYWKAVWDTSKYILTLEIGNLSDPITAQKLKAEALLYQGEALFMFETIRPYMLAASKPDSYSENLKTIHAAVIDPMIQSLNIGINLKDSATIQSAASKIWDYFSSTKASISSGNLAFWTEIFQRLYDGLIECSLQNSNLMVCICIGYITVLKEANEQASIAAAVAAAAAQALETVPAKKGSAGKDKKGAKAPPPPSSLLLQQNSQQHQLIQMPS